MKLISLILILLPLGAVFSCKSTNYATTGNEEPQELNNTVIANSMTDLPQIIIYKTTKNYNHNVPIIMDSERLNIVSYPDPRDVEEGISAPTQLIDGYLLDNRGINENVVYTSYTFDEYSKLTTAPTLQELKSRIIDLYPLQELYVCGSRLNANLEEKGNEIVKSKFEGCREVEIMPMPMVYPPTTNSH